jgi:hypothetical protein
LFSFISRRFKTVVLRDPFLLGEELVMTSRCRRSLPLWRLTELMVMLPGWRSLPLRRLTELLVMLLGWRTVLL